MDFLQKPLAWFSKFYLRVQSKNCVKNSLFLFFFQNFFRIFSNNFSDFWPKNFKKFSKLPSTCPEEQFVAWFFFLKFWIVLDFLQKPSVWFSKFYLRVQSKNCGRNSFLIFLFRIFFRFWAKNFSDFRPKNFTKMWKLPSACPEEQFVAWIFFKSFESFRIFCRHLWHGSQKSTYVSRVKIAEKMVCFCLLFSFFSDFERNFSDFRRKIFKKLSKLPSACPQEQLVA